MTRHRKATRADWRVTAVYLALFVALLILGAILLLPTYYYLWLLLLVAGLLLLVRWHARGFAYRCPGCGHEFEISAWTDLTSPHGADREGGWKLLTCPRCRQRSRARGVKKVSD